jgi:hypothetical protein
MPIDIAASIKAATPDTISDFLILFSSCSSGGISISARPDWHPYTPKAAECGKVFLFNYHGQKQMIAEAQVVG